MSEVTQLPGPMERLFADILSTKELLLAKCGAPTATATWAVEEVQRRLAAFGYDPIMRFPGWCTEAMAAELLPVIQKNTSILVLTALVLAVELRSLDLARDAGAPPVPEPPVAPRLRAIDGGKAPEPEPPGAG